jgi:hypothetical protein
MAPTSKLRIATADVAGALDVVRNEVEHATGLAVHPVLQEVDTTALVVEVAVASPAKVDPKSLARFVDAAAGSLDVLGSWTETPDGTQDAPRPALVLDVVEDPLPEAARRAVRDDVPTAQWLPSVADIAGGDRSYWLLAVPARRSDGAQVVGLSRRQGYSHRFSASEARATALRLAG